MVTRTLAVLCLAAAIAACGPKVKEEERYGVFQEPFEALPLPPDSGAVEMQVNWKKDTGAGSQSGFAILQPFLAGDSVFVASRDGEVLRYERDSGSVLWRTDLDREINAAVGVGEGVAVVAHDDGGLSAVDAISGEPVWSTAIRRQISAVPVIGKGRVVIRTSDGLVMGVDAGNGEVRWQVNKEVPGLTVHGDSTPVITGDAVLVGLSNGRMIANNVINGRDYWEAELDFRGGRDEIERLNDSDTPPVVRGNIVYAATYQGSVVALRLQDASSIWSTELSTRRPMAIAGEQLFVIGALGEVVAINTADGAIQWTQDAFRGHGVSAPVVVGDRVVVGDAEGNLHSLDIASGALVQTLDAVSGAVIGLVSNGSVIAALTSDGELALISP